MILPERERAIVALVLFAAMLAIVGPRHEPWFDEAQAWLLARDATLWDLLAHRVRYEGTPGLWHAILWLLSRAGMPFTCLWMVSGALACAGAWIVLTRAPFPFWLRVGVVFSYFMAYQYAVVARSYALDVLLIPLIAATFASRLQRPVFYGVLLGLLANANAHSFVIAAPLCCEFLLALWRRGGWRPPDFAGCAIYGALAAAAALQAWPPADAFAPRSEILRGVIMTAEAFIDRLEVWKFTLPGRKTQFWGFGASVLLLVPSFLVHPRGHRDARRCSVRRASRLLDSDIRKRVACRPAVFVLDFRDLDRLVLARCVYGAVAQHNRCKRCGDRLRSRVLYGGRDGA